MVDSAWNSPLIGFGGKGNDAYADGHVFMTLPIYSSIGVDGSLGGDYIFIEPYTSLGEGGETASSLGISWRHLFSSEPVSALEKSGTAGFLEEGLYIGVSLFADMLNTQRDNQFWQLGVGAEIGTRYLEVRGNYYIPLTDRELAERRVSSQTFKSSSTAYHTSGVSGGNGGAPYATGNSIVQDFGTQTTFATTTTRTTTIRTITELYEEGMEGWDVELAHIVPWVDQWLEVRLLGGYFSFDNQPFGPQSFGTGNVEGWKAGIEIRPVPAMVLTAMWYEDERFTGENWTVGVQFQIPLGREWKDAFRPRRRHLVERLAEPVRRQNEAIKVGNDVEETTEAKSSVARVTRVVSQSPGRIVLVDDVIFVNNGPATSNGIQEAPMEEDQQKIVQGTGDGTAERPVYEISDGAETAAQKFTETGRVWNVYTQDSGTPYFNSVDVASSTNFISSATPIVAPDGQVFGTGTKPILNGTFRAIDIGRLGIREYIVETMAEGAALRISNVDSFEILNNEISNWDGRGVDIDSQGTVTRSGSLHGNEVSSARTVMEVFVDGSATLNLGLTDNEFSHLSEGNDSGILVSVYSSGTVNITATGNSFRDIRGHGLRMTTNESLSVLNATLNDNTFDQIGGSGIFANEILGAMNIEGSVSNSMLNIGGLRYDASGSPAGQFFIDATLVPAGSDFP